MRVRIRYELPDENGETRNDRATRFGQEQGPEFHLPDEGLYLWEWFWSISNRLRRVQDGVCIPIPPSEFLAWCQASGTIIWPIEYGILCAIDEVFCVEMNAELKDYQLRQEEERKKNNPPSPPRKGRK